MLARFIYAKKHFLKEYKMDGMLNTDTKITDIKNF